MRPATAYRPSGNRRRLHGLKAADSGQSLAEFAVVLPLLLLVFMGIFEFGRFYYTQLTLQHAVREATRYAVTGRTETDPETGEPMSRANSIAQVILHNTQTLSVNLEGITIDPADGGGPEEIVRVGVDFGYEFRAPLIKEFLPKSGVTLTYSTAMRNEPFFE